MVDQRQEKLQKIREFGLDPYPQPNLESKQSCEEVKLLLEQNVTVAGRIMLLRGHGKILFADLQDRTGKIQLFFEQNTLGDLMSQTKLFDLGDIISASGIVFTTTAGEVTIRVSEFQILAKNLRPLPEKFHGLTDVEERYRQRYVDLIVNPESRQVFITRTKILSTIRQFLDNHGFLEVETPILQPVYGGASAKPFITHHNELGQDMYLRIADELYLKRLIVGGFEKVYEVSKDFRNESVSRFHNPEFTQIEFYWAYVDYDVLMKFTEELVVHLVNTIKGSNEVVFQGKTLDFTPPFKRITFRDAILDKTKIDINTIKSEKDFTDKLRTENLKLDTDGVIGLGAMFDALYKEYVRPFLEGPLFLTDYPAEMIALAKKKADDPTKIASFQLLAHGTELLKAYNELNDPKDQYDRWMDEEVLAKKGAQNAMQLDTDYIRALEYGMPPTAGYGMGIDRMTQFLTDSATIKDVILFPSMRNEEKNKETSNEDLIVIGKVLGINPHPNADSLKIFLVDTGKDKFNVISACTNVEVGSIVPVALIGATVPTTDGKTQQIKKSKMRGIDSDAMMCSPLEIGTSDLHDRIYILDPSLEKFLGDSVAEHFHL